MRKNIRAEIAKLLGIYLRSYKSFENDKEKEGDGYCSSAGGRYADERGSRTNTVFLRKEAKVYTPFTSLKENSRHIIYKDGNNNE